jgi:hypothetical protein
MILAGDDWERQIRQGIASAKVAVVFVSLDFLLSHLY